MLDAYIYSGLRTPFGRQAGALAPVRPDNLVATVIKKLIERGSFATEQIEDVVLGCASQAGEDSRNVARHAALLAGLPYTTPGQTVNRLCGSGLAAVLDTARAITAGEGELYIAGGVESMSRAPFVVGKSERAYDRAFEVYDSSLGARFPNPEITRLYGNDTMPQTADNIAKELGILREDSDKYALSSQLKYERAFADDFFKGEIVPIEVQVNKKEPARIVDTDEHPRADSTLESLQRLVPLNKDGVVTAGNASGINDGAAALFVGNRQAGEKAGVQAKARILAGAVSGVEPRLMGLGPAYAIPKALERAQLSLKDMDVIEINEAFASQVLGCLSLLNIPFDDERVNPNGGAIALGHPLGASGSRIVLSTVRELERRGGKYAVVSLCIGVGQGIAVVLERL